MKTPFWYGLGYLLELIGGMNVVDQKEIFFNLGEKESERERKEEGDGCP